MTCKFMYKGVIETRNEPFTGKEGDIIAISGEEYKVANTATFNGGDLQLVRLLRKGEKEDHDGAYRRILADIREM